MFKKLLYLLIFFFMNLLYAQTVTVGDHESYSVLDTYQYSIVHNMNDTPDQVRSQYWYKDRKKLNIGTTHQAYWIYFKVKNAQNRAKSLYLMAERYYVYTMEYYLIKQGEVVHHDTSGFQTRLKHSSFNSSLRTLPVDLAANEEAEIFLKVQNFNRVDIPFQLVTKNYMIEYYQYYSLLQGVFFGIVLIMMLYNLIVYFLTKFKPYFYYVVYVFFVTIYFATNHGFFHRYFEVSSVFIYMLLVTSAIAFIVAGSYFIAELFLFKKHLLNFYKVLKLLLLFFVILAIGLDIAIYLDSFYSSQLLFSVLSLSLGIYAVLILIGLYLLAYKNTSQFALTYALAWTIVIVVGVGLMGTHLGFIAIDIGIDHYFQAVMGFETLLFSVMLAYRIKELEREKQEHQAQLVYQNRLTAMGEMIANIAHQWRQPLSEINGRVLTLDMYYRQNKLDQEVLDLNLNSIENVTNYLSGTITDFMNFFDVQKELETFELSETIEQVIRIAKILTSRHDIDIINTFNDEIELRGYPSELVQALLIVMYNAIDACVSSEVKNSVIIINVYEEKSDIIVSIEDNGGGIPESIMQSIFDPYFTTKYQKQGTGLGLYILKVIIERSMQGEVSVENRRNGAKFSMKISKYLAKK